MTIQLDLTPDQEAALAAAAERERKTVAELLLSRAVGEAASEAERRAEIERRLAAWRTYRCEFPPVTVPKHLRGAKLDAESVYSE